MLSADGAPLNRNFIFAMELMHHSSIDDLLKKAATTGMHFRNEDLRRCVGVANAEYICFVGVGGL